MVLENLTHSEISYTTIAFGDGNNTLNATAIMDEVTITAGKGKDVIDITGELSFSSIKDSAGDASIAVTSNYEDAISCTTAASPQGLDTMRSLSTIPIMRTASPSLAVRP